MYLCNTIAYHTIVEWIEVKSRRMYVRLSYIAERFWSSHQILIMFDESDNVVL